MFDVIQFFLYTAPNITIIIAVPVPFALILHLLLIVDFLLLLLLGPSQIPLPILANPKPLIFLPIHINHLITICIVTTMHYKP